MEDVEVIKIEDIQRLVAVVKSFDPTWPVAMALAISNHKEWKEKKKSKATVSVVRNIVHKNVETQWYRRIFIESALVLIEENKRQAASLKQKAMQYATEA